MSIKAFHLLGNRLIPLKTAAMNLDLFTSMIADGFYTTFSTLAAGTKVLGLKDHLKRLYQPAEEMKLTPSADEKTLRAQIANIAQENLPSESRIRIILTKDTGDIFMAIQAFESLPESVYRNGVHVITSQITRHDPKIKGTNFIHQSQAQRQLVGKDVFEILLTKNGKVYEGMTSNFYAVSRNTLITAQRGILLGVTRKAVLKLAKGQGMQVRYRQPQIKEQFDEAFLTSSSRGVVPIVSIDSNPVGQGKVGKWTKKLINSYQRYVIDKSEFIISK